MKKSIFYKILMAVMLAMCCYVANAEPLARMYIGDRWVENGIYYANVMLDVAEGHQLSFSADIYFQFNADALEYGEFTNYGQGTYEDSVNYRILNLNPLFAGEAYTGGNRLSMQSFVDNPAYQIYDSEGIILWPENETPPEKIQWYLEYMSTLGNPYAVFSGANNLIGTIRLRVKENATPQYDDLKMYGSTEDWIEFYFDTNGDGIAEEFWRSESQTATRDLGSFYNESTPLTFGGNDLTCYTIDPTTPWLVQEPQNSATVSTSATQFCLKVPTTIQVDFNGEFDVSNVTTVQLSDENGNFTSPTVIGTNTGNEDFSIQFTPTLSGTGYRIRAITSNPESVGSDNGTNLVVYPSVLGDADAYADEDALVAGETTSIWIVEPTMGYTYTLTNEIGTQIGNQLVASGDDLFWSEIGIGTYYVNVTSDADCSELLDTIEITENIPTLALNTTDMPTPFCNTNTGTIRVEQENINSGTLTLQASADQEFAAGSIHTIGTITISSSSSNFIDFTVSNTTLNGLTGELYFRAVSSDPAVKSNVAGPFTVYGNPTTGVVASYLPVICSGATTDVELTNVATGVAVKIKNSDGEVVGQEQVKVAGVDMIFADLAPGTYTAVMSYQSACETNLASSISIQEAVPAANQTLTGGGTVCHNENTTFTLSGSEVGKTYVLQIAEEENGEFVSVTSPAVTGTGSELNFSTTVEQGVARVIANDITYGCTNIVSDNVAFHKEPAIAAVQATIDESVISLNETAIISWTSVPNIYYAVELNGQQSTWTIGTGANMTYSVTPSTVGTYNYTIVAAYDADGTCKETVSTPITLNVITNENPVASVANNILCLAEDIFTIHVTNVPPSSTARVYLDNTQTNYFVSSEVGGELDIEVLGPSTPGTYEYSVKIEGLNRNSNTISMTLANVVAPGSVTMSLDGNGFIDAGLLPESYVAANTQAPVAGKANETVNFTSNNAAGNIWVLGQGLTSPILTSQDFATAYANSGFNGTLPVEIQVGDKPAYLVPNNISEIQVDESGNYQLWSVSQDANGQPTALCGVSQAGNSTLSVQGVYYAASPISSTRDFVVKDPTGSNTVQNTQITLSTTFVQNKYELYKADNATAWTGTSIEEKNGIGGQLIVGATESNPGVVTFDIDQPGTYFAKITNTVTGAICYSDKITIEEVLQPALVAWQTSNVLYCEGTNGAELTATGTEVGTSYQLKDATGNNVGNAITASGTSVTWSDIPSGTYSIYGGTEGRGGRTVTETTATVVLVPAPTACTLVANKANYCTADPVTGVNLTFNVTAGEGITYSVVNEDNVALQGAQPSANGYVYTNVAAGTYRGIANVSDCEYEVTDEITINAVNPPDIPVLAGTQSYCEGSEGVQISVSNSNAELEYTLYKGGEVVPGSTKTGTAIIAWTNNLEGTYSVKVSNGYCEVMSNDFAVVEIAKPAMATLAASETNYCASEDGVTLTLSGLTDGVTYVLKNENDETVSGEAQNGTIVYSNVEAGTYHAVATTPAAALQCEYIISNNLIITENPLPQVFALSAPAAYCDGENGVTATLAGSAVGVSYELRKLDDTPFGTAISGTGNSISWSNVPEGSYYVSAETEFGCIAQFGSIEIREVSTPTIPTQINFAAAYCEGSDGSYIHISDVQNGVTYDLYKDGELYGSQTATGNVAFDGIPAGSYNFVARIGESQCTAQFPANDIVITMNPLPEARTLVANNVKYCAAETRSGITLTMASPVGTTSYVLENVATQSTINPNISSPLQVAWNNVPAGSYRVIGTTAAGCTGYVTDNLTIEAVAVPDAPIFATEYLTYCAGDDSVTLTITNAETGSTYTLHNADGEIANSAKTGVGEITWNNMLAGTYTVKVNNGYCEATSRTATVIENPLPQEYVLSASATSYCSGVDGVTLSIPASQIGVIYQLKNNDGANAATMVYGTGNTIVWNNIPAGQYYVDARFTSTGCERTITNTITVNSTTPPQALITAPAEVVQFTTTTLAALETPGAEYLWNVTGGTINGSATGSTVNITWGAAGSATINLVVTKNGCTNTTELLLPILDYIIPGTQAKTILFSSRNTSSMTVRWRRGDGEKCMVVAYEGNTIDELPVLGTTYQANNNFTLGDVIGNGRVVYIGTGTQVNLTGLTPNTTYKYRVFEFNGAGIYNLATASYNPRSTTTLDGVVLPILKPVENITANSADLSWIYTSTQEYALQLTVARNSSFSNVVNGFGNVDLGTYTEYELTGLASGTTYYYRVRAICGSNVSAWVVGSFVTDQTRPTVLPELSFANITSNSLDVTWTSGDADGYVVVMKRDNSPVTAPVDGMPIQVGDVIDGGTVIFANTNAINSGVATVAEVADLEKETMYYFTVFADKMTDDVAYFNQQGVTGSVATLADIPVNPSDLVFSNVTTNGMQLTWNKGDAAKSIVLVTLQNNSFSTMPENRNSYAVGDEFGNATVAAVTEGNSCTVENLVSGARYLFRVLNYNGEGLTSTYSEGYAEGSRMTLTGQPGVLTNLTVSDVTSTSFHLAFNKPSGVNIGTLIVLYNTENPTIPEDGIWLPLDTEVEGEYRVVYNGNGTSCDVTNLDFGTQYHIAAFSYRGRSEDVNYNPAAVLAEATTLGGVPTIAPQNAVASNITTSTMDLSWTTGNGSRTLVIVSENNTFETPVNGTEYVAGNGQSVYLSEMDNLNITGLTSNTPYYFRAYAVSGVGDNIAYSEGYASTSATTAAEVASIEITSGPATVKQNVPFAITITAKDENGETLLLTSPLAVTIATVDADGILSGTTNLTISANESTVTFANLLYEATDTETSLTLQATATGIEGDIVTYAVVRNTIVAPTEQDKRLMFAASAVNTTAVINWTAGNGSNRIMLVKAGSAPAADAPVNGVTYNVGDVLADGSFVAYVGETTSATISNLTAGLTYYFRAYGYDIDETFGPMYCYATASYNPRNRAILAKGDVQPVAEFDESDIDNNNYYVGSINPNPAVSNISMKITALEEINLTFTIYDASGREVQTLGSNIMQRKGTNSYNFELDSELSSGTYILMITSGSQSAIQRFTVVK